MVPQLEDGGKWRKVEESGGKWEALGRKGRGSKSSTVVGRGEGWEGGSGVVSQSPVGRV